MPVRYLPSLPSFPFYVCSSSLFPCVICVPCHTIAVVVAIVVAFKVSACQPITGTPEPILELWGRSSPRTASTISRRQYAPHGTVPHVPRPTWS